MHSFWAFIHRRYYRYNFLRRLLSLWILKVVCFFVLTSTIQAQAPQTVVFGSDAPLTTLQFGLQTEYLSDPTYSLTITSFIHHPPAATGGFIPSPALNPNLGFQNANIWMRFNLKRQAVQSDNHSPHQWFVSLPTMRNIDTVEIYLIREKSIVFADTAGYSVTYRRWTVSSPYIVFPLPLSPGDSVCCYVRFRLQGIFLLRPSLQTAESLQQTQYTLGTDVYTFYGIATFALLYNILLFFLIRSKFYAFYIIYVITITVHISLIVGYFYQTVTPNLPGIQPRLLLLFTLITNIINVVFVQEFLKERRGILLPKFWDYIIFIYVVGSLGCICAEFLGMRSVAVYGSFYLPVFLGMPATLATTMIAWRKGYSPAAYLFISRAVLECGLALNYITAINLLPVGIWFTGKIIYYAPALEMILFAFALGERISVLQNDKREAERKALEGEVYRLKNEELAQANAEILRQQEVLVEQARDIELANSMLNEKNLRLGETLDQLKVAQSRLVQSEKMASLGIVTAGMAHEINNPITFIAASIPILRRTFDHVIEIIQYYEPLANARTIEVVQDTLREIERLKKTLEFEFLVEDIHQCLSSIQHGVERITDVVRGLRVFSRLDEDVLKFVNLHEGLDATLAILRHQYEGRIGISKHYGANVPDIECFSSQIHQVFMNILANAIQAIPDSGSITITTKLHDKHVQISITDTGVGMNQEIQRHIFDPFYTTKPIGQGTGLGLAIVYGIIEKHSGKIAVQSVPQQGTTMTVDLPVRQR